MLSAEARGQIVTFYSFKGGVGRTMALANIAFLAALNGKRVLVMDWDLEAPGLLYYFRGLLDAPDARAVKDSPGVMDILWEWNRTFKGAPIETLNAEFQQYQEGRAFSECCRALLPEGLFEGELHYISAGQSFNSDGQAYEELLAKFSWSEFFEEAAGGHLLDSFRKWSKSNYDLILIDSRTGLADVAGICTMQIPDQVVMCFVLNRQNIDGISKVSHAIRARRGRDVELRVAPMRTARQDTSEESDARARAVSELIKVGGYSAEQIAEDFQGCQIPASENVPFYETLAPLTASDPNLDPLTLRYLKFASSIVGEQLGIVRFQDEWIRTVRGRLQPRHATVEYVEKLSSSEPARAREELNRLLDSAYEAELDGAELEEEYVRALTFASFVVSDASEEPFGDLALIDRALDLIRLLYASNQSNWKALLISALEKFWESSSYLIDPEHQAALLEELEGIFSLDDDSASKIKRLAYRRHAARLQYSLGNQTLAGQIAGEVLSAIQDWFRESQGLTRDQVEELTAIEADVFRLRGDISFSREDYQSAVKAYQSGLAKARSVSGDHSRQEFIFYTRLISSLSRSGDWPAASAYSLQAARIGGTMKAPIAPSFVSIARPVVRLADPALGLAFVDAAFCQDERVVNQFGSYLGRQPKATTEFFSTAASLVLLISSQGLEGTRALGAIAQVVLSILRSLSRRIQATSDKQRESIVAEVTPMIEIYLRRSDLISISMDLRQALAPFTVRQRSSRPQRKGLLDEGGSDA